MPDPASLTVDELSEALLEWTRSGIDATSAAAATLLVQHRHWLTDRNFVGQCLLLDADGLAWIRWSQVRERLDNGHYAYASSTERGVLELAAALGTDRFALGRMGDNLAAMVATAFVRAADPRVTGLPALLARKGDARPPGGQQG